MNDNNSPLGKILRLFGNAQKLEDTVSKIRAGETVDDADAEGNRQALDKYTIDLYHNILLPHLII